MWGGVNGIESAYHLRRRRRILDQDGYIIQAYWQVKT